MTVKVEVMTTAGEPYTVLIETLATGATKADLLAQITLEQKWRYREAPNIYDASQNTEMQDTDVIVDGRHYVMYAWIRSVAS